VELLGEGLGEANRGKAGLPGSGSGSGLLKDRAQAAELFSGAGAAEADGPSALHDGPIESKERLCQLLSKLDTSFAAGRAEQLDASLINRGELPGQEL